MQKHFVVRQSKRNEKKIKKYRTAAVRFTEDIIARTTTAAGAAATIVNGCFSIRYHAQFEYLHNKNEKKEINAIRSKK